MAGLPSEAEARLSAADSARLLLNTPRVANRWVWVAGRRYPILHLSIADLAEFRAHSVSFENFLAAAEREGGFAKVIHAHTREVRLLLDENVVWAAALALGLPETHVRQMGAHPLELLIAIGEQWIHNLETDYVRRLFPMPEDDDDDDDDADEALDGDPSAENPLAIVERMASGFHWPPRETLSLTMPQVYLLSNSSAWSYARTRRRADRDPDAPDKPKKQKLEVAGKRFKRIRDMTREEYQAYLAENMAGVFS